MKLQNKITVCVNVGDEKVTFVLRRATNKENNEFQAKRFGAGNNAGARLEALEEYFDVLLIGVENLEDDSGAITVDRKDAIPANWKQDIIAKLELETKIDIKN